MTTPRRRYTNKSLGWRGDTVVVSARVPRPVAEQMDAAIGQEGLPNRGAVLQDACTLWALMEERDAGGTGHGTGSE